MCSFMTSFMGYYGMRETAYGSQRFEQKSIKWDFYIFHLNLDLCFESGTCTAMMQNHEYTGNCCDMGSQNRNAHKPFTPCGAYRT